MRGTGLPGCCRVVATAAVLAAAAGVVAWLYTLPSSADGLSMGDYGLDKQRDWAQQLVAGLNTREALQVPVLRPSGMLPGAQASTIAAAMPESRAAVTSWCRCAIAACRVGYPHLAWEART